MSRLLGLESGDSRDSIETELLSGAIITPAEWPMLADVLERGGKSDREQARRFRQLAALSPSDRVEIYLDIFCTRERGRRASIVSQSVKDGALGTAMV